MPHNDALAGFIMRSPDFVGDASNLSQNWGKESGYVRPPSEHNERRAKHAQQLRGRFNRTSRQLQEILGIYPDHLHEPKALCKVLGIEDAPMVSRRETEALLYDHFPDRHLKGFTRSFARIKNPEDIDGKKGRNSKDTYGVQIWINDPNIIKKIASSDGIQNHFRRACDHKLLEFNSDNHFKFPKAHGHRGVHYEAKHRSSKDWSEWEEIQIYDANMMLPYLQSRKPYEALRALKAQAVANGRTHSESLLASEKAVAQLLNEYILALYEEVAHEADHIQYVDKRHEHQPTYRTAKEARFISDQLEETVIEITNEYANCDYNLGELMMRRPDLFGLEEEVLNFNYS